MYASASTNVFVPKGVTCVIKQINRYKTKQPKNTTPGKNLLVIQKLPLKNIVFIYLNIFTHSYLKTINLAIKKPKRGLIKQ